METLGQCLLGSHPGGAGWGRPRPQRKQQTLLPCFRMLPVLPEETSFISQCSPFPAKTTWIVFCLVQWKLEVEMRFEGKRWEKTTLVKAVPPSSVAHWRHLALNTRCRLRMKREGFDFTSSGIFHKASQED